MFLEFIYIVSSLSIFSLIWVLVYLRKNQTITDRIIYFLMSFGFQFGFYGYFFWASGSESLFFRSKALVFSHYYLAFSILLAFITYFLNGKDGKWAGILGIILLSPFLYFFLFGNETYQIFFWKIPSLYLWKPQNPMIILALLPAIFVPWYFFVPIWMVLFLGISVYYPYQTLQKLSSGIETEIIYQKYLPHEFFLSGETLLIEETMGIYNFIRPVEVEEPIYKFTMKPLRRLNQVQRQPIQRIVDSMEFPIVLKEENIVTIYDLSRSLEGEIFRVIYNLETGGLELKGPLF